MTATHQQVFDIALYARADDYERVIQAIADNEGEITEELGLQLAAVEDQFDVKAERVALYIRNLEAMADATTEEIERLVALRNNRKNTAASLKGYLMEQMERTGKTTIDRPLAKLSIVNNGGQPAVKYAGDPKDLPLLYRMEKVAYSIHRENVLRAAEAGNALPEGLTVERGKRLQIK